METEIRILGAADYVVLVLLLVICTVIGYYYGFLSERVSARAYLLGGKNMKLLPTSLSLIATTVTGTFIVAYPAETYLNGIQFVYTVFGILLIPIISSTFFLPVLYNLDLTSVNEYFEMRFSNGIRLFLSALYLIRMIFALPKHIYISAIVFNQVTGINLHYASFISGVVCIFYTCAGGYKAVMWTEVIQALCMFSSLLIAIVVGLVKIGGPSVVWQRGLDGGRIEAPVFEFDPTITYTFWSMVIGYGTFSLSSELKQSMYQRYMSLPRLRSAKAATFITAIFGNTFFTLASCYLGLLIYAAYYDCDPIATNAAKGKDQVVPLFVMATLGNVPGLPGIFVAGVFSATLSRLASSVNAMSGVIFEDIFTSFYRKPLTERQKTLILKFLVIILGVISVALVFVIEKLGTIMQITFTVGGITNGTVLAVFLMGIFLPWVNTRGVMAGCAAGMMFISWIVFGSHTAFAAAGRSRFSHKHLSVEGCSNGSLLGIVTIGNSSATKHSDIFVMYRLSYMWYSPMSCIVTITVGVLVSFLIGANDIRTVDRRLLCPAIRRFIPKLEDEFVVAEPTFNKGYQLVTADNIPQDIDQDIMEGQQQRKER